MGAIVGAAIVSHNPGLFMPQERRLKVSQGADSSLIAGFERIRGRIDALNADTFVIFDTHWITTGRHVVAGQNHFKGTYTSDELPWLLRGVAYDYPGAPALARRVRKIAKARRFAAYNATDPHMANHYATLNVLAFLHRGEKVLSVGSCQNATRDSYLAMGAIVGEAVADSDTRAVLLASGALSHAFTNLDSAPVHENLYHPDNVSSRENAALDDEIVGLFQAGRHGAVLERYGELRRAEYEGFAAHIVQMIGALGGDDCQAKGEPMSDYENAAGTGNRHIWFDLPTPLAA